MKKTNYAIDVIYYVGSIKPILTFLKLAKFGTEVIYYAIVERKF